MLPKNTNQKPKAPTLIGPFRGLIIKFRRNTNFENFQNILFNITFKHPNFYKSSRDKRKCIIYYKNPYDVALLLEKYRDNHNQDFSIYLWLDEISTTLRPDILYIAGKLSSELKNTLQQLQGSVITTNQAGIQVKFENFKQAAIAHEEIRKDKIVKFAYKSKVSYIGRAQSTKSHSNIPLINEVNNMVSKYKTLTLTMQEEFNYAIKPDKKDDQRKNMDKIKKASENLELANISWNQKIEEYNENHSTLGSQESESWETSATPSHEMLELHKIYKQLFKDFSYQDMTFTLGREREFMEQSNLLNN